MPSLDTNLKASPFTQSANALRELAEYYWRAAGFAPDPNPYRMQAMALHAEAIKLEAAIADAP